MRTTISAWCTRYGMRHILTGMCIAVAVSFGAITSAQTVKKAVAMQPVEIIALPIEGVRVEDIASREERLRILEDISNTIRINYDSIATLAGIYRLQDRQLLTDPELLKAFDPDDSSLSVPVQLATQAIIEFAIDLKGDRLYTSCQPTGARMLIERATLRTAVAQGLAPPEIRAIITVDGYVYADPNAQHGAFMGFPEMGAGPTRAAFREPRSNADAERYGMIVDPRKLFQGTIPYADEIDAIRHLVESPENNPRTIALKRVKGADFERYTIIVTATLEGTWRSCTTIVDSRIGFNVVIENFEAEGAGTTQSKTMNYGRVGEVFVPAEVVLSLPSKQKDQWSFQRTLILEKAAVDFPLEDDMFGYARLGLGEGDRVLDRIEGSGYVLKSGRLARCSIEDAGPKPHPRQSSRVLFFFGVIPILLFALWFAIQKRSPKGQAGPA